MLLYREMLARIEDSSSKVSAIEAIFREFNVKMNAPTDVFEFEQAISFIEDQKKTASSHTFGVIEAEISS